jgi:pectate lyase
MFACSSSDSELPGAGGYAGESLTGSAAGGVTNVGGGTVTRSGGASAGMSAGGNVSIGGGGGAGGSGRASGGVIGGGGASQRGGAGSGAVGGGIGGSVGTGGAPSSGGSPGTGGSTGSCTEPAPSPLVGWASVSGTGTPSTTGGDGGATTTVSTLADLTAAVSGTTVRTVLIRGSIDGSISIGSNKTLVGLCGAKFHGHIGLNKSVNVIVRNLTVVGYGCTDNPSDCSGGADAVTVQDAAHHLWFDHDDISDGSDGNLDLTHAADFVTVSWTKFHYSGRRTDPAGASGGHQFSNLIGHSDGNASEDAGHLRITFHHTWWADNVVERMPRARFGQVHLFNNLYTATGNDYCIGVGNGVSIRNDNNVFIGVANPIKSYSTDGTGVILSTGNDYRNTTGSKTDVGSGTVFSPPYTVTLDSTATLEAAIRAGAGPR